MTDHKSLDDQELDALFAEAQDDAPTQMDALMARIMADAQAVLEPAEQMIQTAPESTLITRLLRALETLVNDAFGGWKAAGGVVAAGILGLSYGLSSPDALMAYTASEAVAYTDEATTGIDALASSFYGLSEEGL